MLLSLRYKNVGVTLQELIVHKNTKRLINMDSKITNFNILFLTINLQQNNRLCSVFI